MTRNCFAAACAALEPYQWRGLTAEHVARRVLDAVDIAAGIRTSPSVGAHDPRIDELVGAMSGLAWRELRVDTLCRHLLERLDAWRVRDAWLDVELAWLLDQSA